MNTVTPFKEIPLGKYFQHDVERIMMAYRLSETIRSELSNIRASGDQVELAVKQFFVEKLSPNYHVCDGHIIDKNLKASPQFDIIISENNKNPILFSLADKSELFYYESVYCFAEVKRSFYKNTLIKDFSRNIERVKSQLTRNEIAPTFIECAKGGFHIPDPVTKLPLRNPLFCFMIFIDGSQTDHQDLTGLFHATPHAQLPNFVAFFDLGIVINVNKSDFDNKKITVNLYPEHEADESIWVLMNLQNRNNVLTYLYMLVVEHLNSSVVEAPDLKHYSSKLFDFSHSNFTPL